jgi:hypothetical protein
MEVRGAAGGGEVTDHHDDIFDVWWKVEGESLSGSVWRFAEQKDYKDPEMTNEIASRVIAKAAFHMGWILAISTAEIKAQPYRTFLQSDFWQDVRRRVLARDNGRCRVCDAPERLEVHHRTYDHHGAENLFLNDLTTLCHDCHELYERNKRTQLPPSDEVIEVIMQAAAISRSQLAELPEEP